METSEILENLKNKVGCSNAALERILGLPQRSLESKEQLELPETQALLKILATYPKMFEVVEYGFDPALAKLILIRERLEVEITNRKAELYKERISNNKS